ncbi:MAG: hypothetical protein DRP57_13310 [Spirochaetes bacterium]|nr:MAG: hypothetical protein DRP57_13310 [Spirochaetota bacterium]
MNEKSRELVRYIVENGGRVTIEQLRQCPAFHPARVGALMTGEKPSIIKQGGWFVVTQDGLQRLGIQVESRQQSVIRPVITESDTKSLVKIKVTRERYTYIEIEVANELAEWLRVHGRLVPVNPYHINNWDAKQTDKIVSIDLPQDLGFYRGDYIIGWSNNQYRLNITILLLAAANGNKWKVRYKALISKEAIVEAVKRFNEQVRKLWIEYIRPVKVESELRVIE